MMIHTNSRRSTLRALALAALVCLAMPACTYAQQGSFERTLSVTGPVELNIRTGSGSILVHRGPDGTVKISGRIRAGNSLFSGDATARVRQIEKNPPIEQSGSTIRVGQQRDETLFRNISISFDVTVPAQATVNAASGSGSVNVGDLRGPVEARTGSGSIVLGRIGGTVVVNTGSGNIEVAAAQGLDARTGSGSIEARGIGGGVKAHSGSGSIRVEHTGKGDVDVSSSSGEVIVTGVDGAARVSASSGSIRLEGRPSAPWSVDSSSGGITLRIPPDAAFDLDARTSSGGMDSAHPVTTTGRVSRHRMQGKVRGGGPLVAVSTASGSVRVE